MKNSIKSLSLIFTFLFVSFIGNAFAGNEFDPTGFIPTNSGLKYSIDKQGNGEKKAQIGERVKIHCKGTLENGTVFLDTRKFNSPMKFEIGAGKTIKGLDEAVTLLKVGDKASIIVPSSLGYGSKKKGGIPANSELKFEIEILEINPAIKVEPFNTSGKMFKQNKYGVKFINVEKGNGETISKGDRVRIHFSAYTKKGKLFASSVKENQSVEFVVGNKEVIKGLDKTVRTMKEGDKARLFIPKNLTFCNNNYVFDTPYDDIIIDLEIIKVKK